MLDTEFGKIGVAICFDIRFPELYRLMALQGAQMIFTPAAFSMTTGRPHWELAFRSRALDKMCIRDRFSFCIPYTIFLPTFQNVDIICYNIYL